MKKIGSFEKIENEERFLTEIFKKEDGGYLLKKISLDMVANPIYNTIEKDIIIATRKT
jgi:hypothetical protein